jgi:hypothetical protein
VDPTDKKKKCETDVLARAVTANFGEFPDMEQPNIFIFSSFSEGLTGDKTRTTKSVVLTDFVKYWMKL